MDLSSLNKEQKEAVETVSGPLLVVAGAGSGKTKVLTNRIAYLLEKEVSPYNILAITFTNKAAKEMKDRIVNLVGEKAMMMQISTFHSFGLRLIRENYNLLNLTNNFSILDSEDSLSVVKKILKDMNVDPKKYAKNFRNRISNLKNDTISPEEFIYDARVEEDKTLAETYKKYQKLLKDNNAVDFDDLLILPLELFKNKEILSHYQDKFKYILIDEYQDTNEAQYKLVKLLAKKYQNICVVGDSDQSIYGFRGANYRNILNFEKDYPLCKKIVLDKNYRSTKEILDVANSIIKNNINRFDKDLVATKESIYKPVYFTANNGLEETMFITNEIKKLVTNGADLNDIVILYRTNAQSRFLEESLMKSNIHYRIVGGVGFYQRKEIKDIIAYLKIMINPSDTVSITRVINTPKRGIGDKTVENLINLAEEKQDTLFNVLDSNTKTKKFKDLINDMKNNSDGLSLTEIIEMVIDKSGLREELENEKTLEAESRIENMEEFKSVAKAYEDETGLVSLEDFLYAANLSTDADEQDYNESKVTLMTIHQVKGLEFRFVFIVGVEEGLFPHSMCMGSNEEIEEERRLMYVAVTRAKERLFITNARERLLYGTTQRNIESRFCKEINKDLIEKIGSEETPIERKNCGIIEERKHFNKEDQYTENNTEYQVGDFVYHENFGAGKVLEVSNSVIKIAFKLPYGIKTLMKNHKSIRKV